ncbi:hypothetical protein [Novosphingobium jiangmenense]|uniref:Uncharacterized protein n=1 Tax=Novosphingobium jiangmenense TaxID=2791981 RepID=A0ABS0HG65_9SPHN|nr:hypothetical protein [Novosphingobium jiangmenense]MBF9151253.1 hypothetical protein [Novosphingobium jiangmenense]
MDDINDLDSIPGMPSAESIRTELLRTAGPEYWRPNGEQDGKPTDFTGLPEETRNKVLGARVLQGPGPSATPYQQAIFDQHQKAIALEKEEARLLERMTEIKGYDRDTGEGISSTSEDQMVALSHLLTQVQRERALLMGEGGQIRLRRKLEESVRKVQERHREAYIMAEAKRRAAAAETEERIAAMAAGIRRTKTNK